MSIRLALGALALCLACAGIARAQEAKADAKVLVGPLDIPDRLDLPGGFGPDFVKYVPEPRYADPLGPYIKDADILVFVATWCDDSRQWIPLLIKLCQAKGVDPKHLKIVGLDRDKHSPGHEEQPYNIVKVPTVIFLKNGLEMGRIVEEPIGLLEKDILGLFMPLEQKVMPAPMEPGKMEENHVPTLYGHDKAEKPPPPPPGSENLPKPGVYGPGNYPPPPQQVQQDTVQAKKSK
jgi:thiol-disulfide isomerase/thioredoxin